MKTGEQDDQRKKFSLNDRVRSFENAFSGLAALLKYEHNARIHLLILVIVIVAGILFRISAIDWIAIVFASGMVFVTECFNTSVEQLSDVVSPGHNETIKKVKDVAAAGVLIAAVVSVIIGTIVFLPEICKLLVP